MTFSPHVSVTWLDVVTPDGLPYPRVCEIYIMNITWYHVVGPLDIDFYRTGEYMRMDSHDSHWQSGVTGRIWSCQ